MLFAVNTMSHIALGDVAAVTLPERIFNIVALIIFAYVYAFLFGNIVSMATELVPAYFFSLNDRY
jgi:hypothetical protein